MSTWNSLRHVRLAHVAALAVIVFAAAPVQAQVNIGGFIIGGDNATFAIDQGGTYNTVQINDLSQEGGEGFNNASELGPLNGTTTKLGVIHTAQPTMLGYTNPNAQVDLRRIWLGSSLVNNEGYLYFAWERDSKNGSGVVLFEFQQDPAPGGCNFASVNVGTCNPWASRQPGDFLIVWDQSGSSINIIKRTFMATDSNQNGSWDPATEPLFLDAGQPLSGNFVKAAISPDGFKGEAAINLSQTIFQGVQGKCLSIANVIPGTVTGNSDTADYKDTLLFAYPRNVVISSCGEVEIRKDSGVGSTGTFPYTLDRITGSTPLKYTGEYLLSDSFNGDYRDEVPANPTVNGFVVYDDIIAGTDYRLTEGTLDSAWTNNSIICTSTGYTSGDVKAGTAFEVRINVRTTCTIVNAQVPRTLKVKKVVAAGFGVAARPGSDFQYKLIKGATEQTGLTFLNNAGEQEYSIGIGTNYQVVETTQIDGWVVSYSTECQGTMQAGASPVCTVTNTATINNNVNIITRQLVVLQDKAILTGIRRGSSEAATVTFKLWEVRNGAGVCQTQVGSSQTVNITYPADASITTITVGPNAGFTIERPNGTTVGPLVRYWTAEYSGNSYNAPKATDCSEVTTITLAP
jgi:hypothetical protein